MSRATGWNGLEPKRWTERRLLFLRLTASGHSVQAIRRIMGVSASGYCALQADCMFMLQANNMAHMVSRALQDGLITLDDTLRFSVYSATNTELEHAQQYLGVMNGR